MPTRYTENLHQAGTNWGGKPSIRYTCAWCDSVVGAIIGIDLAADVNGREEGGHLRLCTNCGYPSLVDPEGAVTPAVAYGDDLSDAPEMVARLYDEARECVSVGAPHAAVMVCRKILMHVAVLQGAKEGESFLAYVKYLVDNHLVPPNTEPWVDEIRQIGNDANHEIFDIGDTEAKAAVDFVGMLLKLLYEFPAKGKASIEARAQKDAAATAES